MNEPYTAHNGPYTISTDQALLDLDAIHAALDETYWAKGRPREVTERAISNSLAFGMYRGKEQVGFARVITDYATFAYLADVYVLQVHRGQALGKWLIATVTAHPGLQTLRRFLLATRDAHGLYSQYAFTPLEAPERWMERFKPYVL